MFLFFNNFEISRFFAVRKSSNTCSVNNAASEFRFDVSVSSMSVDDHTNDEASTSNEGGMSDTGSLSTSGGMGNAEMRIYGGMITSIFLILFTSIIGA